jgi:hypothetical protein
MSSEVTALKHRGLAPAWKPGQSGNPLGRPKGSRSKFSEAFLDDFYSAWQAHGAEVIKRVRDEHPDVYLKVAASILPKEFDIRPTDFSQMTDGRAQARVQWYRIVRLLMVGESTKLLPHCGTTTHARS